MFTAAHVAAKIERLLEGKEARSGPTPARRPQQHDVASRIGSAGRRIVRMVHARRLRPRLYPWRRPSLKLGENAAAYVRIKIAFHGDFLSVGSIAPTIE